MTCELSEREARHQQEIRVIEKTKIEQAQAQLVYDRAVLWLKSIDTDEARMALAYLTEGVILDDEEGEMYC